MIIARQKKEENIIEYLIYMFQIEDAIRANDFDMERIKRNLVNQYDQPREKLVEIEEWYTDLASGMISEGIQKSGHLKYINDIISELNDFHLTLINSKDEKYLELFSWALPNIVRMREKSEKDLKDIEICINGLYMIILMRFQQKEISRETLEAISTFTNLVAYLAHFYNKRKSN